MRVLLSSPGFFAIAGYRIMFWLKTKVGEASNPLLKYFLKLLLKFFNRVVGINTVRHEFCCRSPFFARQQRKN